MPLEECSIGKGDHGIDDCSDLQDISPEVPPVGLRFCRVKYVIRGVGLESLWRPELDVGKFQALHDRGGRGWLRRGLGGVTGSRTSNIGNESRLAFRFLFFCGFHCITSRERSPYQAHAFPVSFRALPVFVALRIA